MTDVPAEQPVQVVKKQPKIVSYGAALFARMSEEATEIEGVPIWQGRLIQTCLDVGIPEGYYKKVVDALESMGSIERITTGRRGNTLTAIALKAVPTQATYDETIVKSGFDGLTGTPSPAMLAAQIGDINKRIGGLATVDMVIGLQSQLDELKTAVQSLKDQFYNNSK